MTASDIMTKEVISIAPGRTVKEALDLLLKNGINQIPVVGREGNVQGIITIKLILSHIIPEYIRERFLEDVAFAPDLPKLYKNFAELSRRDVSEIMERGVRIHHNTPVLEIATLLVNPHKPVDALLVVGEDDRLLGIISARDVIRCCSEAIK